MSKLLKERKRESAVQRAGGRALQAEGSARAPTHCVERSGSHLGGTGQRS